MREFVYALETRHPEYDAVYAIASLHKTKRGAERAAAEANMEGNLTLISVRKVEE